MPSSTPGREESTDRPPSPRRRGSSLFWMLPALTFLAGLLLGGVLVGVTAGGSGGIPGFGGEDETATEAGGEADSEGSPQDPGDRTVTVPVECLEAAERSQEALGLTRQAAEAIGSFDARRLQEIVDELQGLEPEVNALARSCQDRAASAQRG